MTDAELAAELAGSTGEILLAIRKAGLLHGRALGIAGDKIANHYILDALRAQRPDDGILSEESVDTTESLTHERVWIIDPLDGTREYRDVGADRVVHICPRIHGHPAGGGSALTTHRGHTTPS